jgi:putative transposase
MTEIISLLSILHPILDKTTAKQFSIIIEAMFTMTGRCTMLGISRWASKGGSYRTIQRLFKKKLPWMKLFWCILKTHLLEKDEPIILAGDETVVTKAGKDTYGLGRFYSSIYNRALPSLSFQTISIISTRTRKSFPIAVEQIKSKPKNKENKAQNPKNKRGRGRPKGSKNKNKKDVKLSDTLVQLQKMLKEVLKLISPYLKPTYFVYDGAFGHNNAVQMTRQTGLHLISKLRRNIQLCFQFDGIYCGRGRPIIYGDAVDFSSLPSEYFVWSHSDGKNRTAYYRFIARHKKFADPLNVVVIFKTDLKTKKTAKVILFCTDLELSCEKIVDYYRLRFQIEFNFRDAKQYFGLEDFMVLSEQSVCNAVHFSFFCANISQVLMKKTGEQSIIDLKLRYHGRYYATQILKIVSKLGSSIKKDELLDQIPIFGSIHRKKKVA